VKHTAKIRAIRKAIDDDLVQHPELCIPERDHKKTRRLPWSMMKRRNRLRQFATRLHSIASAPTLASDINRTERMTMHQATTAKVEAV